MNKKDMPFRCPSCQPTKNSTHRPNDSISDLKQIISRQASIRNITDLLWLLQSLSRPNYFSLSQKPNFKDFPTELGWNIANYWKLLLHYKMTLYLNLFATFPICYGISIFLVSLFAMFFSMVITFVIFLVRPLKVTLSYFLDLYQ